MSCDDDDDDNDNDDDDDGGEKIGTLCNDFDISREAD